MRKSIASYVAVAVVSCVGCWLFTACNNSPSAAAGGAGGVTQWEYCTFNFQFRPYVMFPDRLVIGDFKRDKDGKALDEEGKPVSDRLADMTPAWEELCTKLGVKVPAGVYRVNAIANHLGGDGWEFVQRAYSTSDSGTVDEMHFRRPKK